MRRDRRQALITAGKMNLGNKLAALGLAILSAAAACQQIADPLQDARALIAAGALAKSEDMLHSYIQSHPASADAHFLLGYVLFREQKAKESLAEFTAGAKYRRPKADELKTVASDYVMLGAYADADKWFSQVTAEKPTDANAWYLLGRTKYNESSFAEAITCFQRALALKAKYIEAEDNLGLSWRESNEPEKAKAAFQTAIDWQGDIPSDPQPFLNLGTLLADESAFGKAVPYLEKAVALSPKNPRIHDELAKVYEAQNNLPKAQSELEKAVALAPEASELHYKLGRMYRREGLRDRAQREFELCDKLNSTHSSVETPNPYLPDKPAPQ
jgi:tetratricopeptide (TPR) repeat protein